MCVCGIEVSTSVLVSAGIYFIGSSPTSSGRWFGPSCCSALFCRSAACLVYLENLRVTMCYGQAISKQRGLEVVYFDPTFYKIGQGDVSVLSTSKM